MTDLFWNLLSYHNDNEFIDQRFILESFIYDIKDLKMQENNVEIIKEANNSIMKYFYFLLNTHNQCAFTLEFPAQRKYPNYEHILPICAVVIKKDNEYIEILRKSLDYIYSTKKFKLFLTREELNMFEAYSEYDFFFRIQIQEDKVCGRNELSVNVLCNSDESLVFDIIDTYDDADRILYGVDQIRKTLTYKYTTKHGLLKFVFKYPKKQYWMEVYYGKSDYKITGIEAKFGVQGERISKRIYIMNDESRYLAPGSQIQPLVLGDTTKKIDKAREKNLNSDAEKDIINTPVYMTVFDFPLLQAICHLFINKKENETAHVSIELTTEILEDNLYTIKNFTKVAKFKKFYNSKKTQRTLQAQSFKLDYIYGNKNKNSMENILNNISDVPNIDKYSFKKLYCIDNQKNPKKKRYILEK